MVRSWFRSWFRSWLGPRLGHGLRSWLGHGWVMVGMSWISWSYGCRRLGHGLGHGWVMDGCRLGHG